MEFFMNNLTTIIGGGSAGIILWVLKRIPNEDIYNWVETGSRAVGVAMTLGLSKWRFSSKYWNATIEPWFVDLIENTCGAFVSGIIKGLKSDE